MMNDEFRMANEPGPGAFHSPFIIRISPFPLAGLVFTAAKEMAY
jgi:hypothetical protein